MNKMQLKNVRISFPHLFKRNTKFGEDGAKFELVVMLHKENQAKEIKAIQAEIATLIKELGQKVASDKLCFKDGDDADRPEYEGHMVLSLKSNKRPTVIDRDKSPLVEDDGKPYAGCFCNVIFDMWKQDNSWGRRINGNLYGVQFAKDGEAFSSGDVDVTDEFDELEDEDDLLG